MKNTPEVGIGETNIRNLKVGSRVWARTGCYAPISYMPNGEPVKHIRGVVVEILLPNIVAVKFDEYPNVVDMLAREIVAGF